MTGVPARTREPPPRVFSRFERGLQALGFHGTALKRFQKRCAVEEVRYFLDAAKDDRTTQDWRKVGATGDEVVRGDAKKTSQRAEYLVASTPYAQRAKQMVVDAVVGSGISTQTLIQYSRRDTPQAKIDNAKANKEVEELKFRWMEEADVAGQQHWYDMQSSNLSRTMIAGGVLLHRKFLKEPGRVLPLAFEQIEVSRLTEFRAESKAGNVVKNGVEYDPDGRVVAYHIDQGDFRARTERIEVEEMRQIYRVDRPGQPIGMSWFAPIIPDLYRLNDIKEYSLIARKIQAAMAVIVADPPNGGNFPAMPGGAPASGADTTNAGGDPLRFVEPGMIHRVGQGQVTSFMPTPSNDLDDLVKLVLRGIGVGFGISYEWVSGDYREVSFAGGRLTRLDTKRRIKPIHAWYTRRAEDWAHRSFMDIGLAMGKIKPVPVRADKYAVAFSQPQWEWGVNPLQEVKAAIAAIEAGIDTMRDVNGNLGRDWQDQLEQVDTEHGFGGAMGQALYQALYQTVQAETGTESGESNGPQAS